MGWGNSVHVNLNTHGLGSSLALAHTRHAMLWDLLLHLHTHLMLCSGIFSCTCTHTSCYALASSLALAHTLHATLWDLLLHLHTHTYHATLWDLLLHLHTHVMLRSGIFSCTCTHTSCYAAGLSIYTSINIFTVLWTCMEIPISEMTICLYVFIFVGIYLNIPTTHPTGSFPAISASFSFAPVPVHVSTDCRIACTNSTPWLKSQPQLEASWLLRRLNKTWGDVRSHPSSSASNIPMDHLRFCPNQCESCSNFCWNQPVSSAHMSSARFSWCMPFEQQVSFFLFS